MATRRFCDRCSQETEWNYSSYQAKVDGFAVSWHTHDRNGNCPDLCKRCVEDLLNNIKVITR